MKKPQILIIVGVILVAGFAATLVVFRQDLKPRPSDTEISNDLYSIEKALVSYQDANSGKFPSSLKGLRVANLEGDINQYSYKITYQEAGAPSKAYEICAVFKDSKSLDEIGTQYPNTTPYSEHRAGRQCYENNFYKGQSHHRVF